MLSSFYDIDFVISITIKLFAFYGLIKNIEHLYNHRQYENDGVLGWQVLRLRARTPVKFIDRYLNFVVTYKGTVISLVITALLYLCLLLSIARSFFPFFLAIVFFYNAVFIVRNAFDREASHAIGNFLCFALLIITMFKNNPVIETYALVFIAAQALFAYFSSGMFKLVSVRWRSGNSLFEVLNLKTMGNQYLSQLVEKNNYLLAKLTSWFIMLLLLLTPFSVFFSPFVCLCFLVACAIFHIINAAILGVNRFLWAFVATYPAIMYLSTLVNL